jgi:hypothetical protein
VPFVDAASSPASLNILCSSVRSLCYGPSPSVLTAAPTSSSEFLSRVKPSSRRPSSPKVTHVPRPLPLEFLPDKHQPHQQAPATASKHVVVVLSPASPSKHSIGLPLWLGGLPLQSYLDSPSSPNIGLCLMIVKTIGLPLSRGGTPRCGGQVQ